MKETSSRKKVEYFVKQTTLRFYPLWSRSSSFYVRLNIFFFNSTKIRDEFSATEMGKSDADLNSEFVFNASGDYFGIFCCNKRNDGSLWKAELITSVKITYAKTQPDAKIFSGSAPDSLRNRARKLVAEKTAN